MTISRTDALAIASRYAAAIFPLSEAASASDTVAEELTALGQSVKDSAELASFLKNPLIGREAKSAALQELAAKGDKLTKRALATIAEQGRAELLPVISEVFAATVAAAKGELIAEVTSARTLSPAIEKQIADALKKATGKPVHMTMKEDQSVLGGVKIQLGSLLLDATLAGALDGMRARLLTNTN